MFDLKAVIESNQGKSLELLEEHINPQFARVLKIIGFDQRYVKGQGQYLWDEKGDKYLDCLAGYGVFACGRNHPTIRDGIKQAMDMDLPNLIKMGAYRLSGMLAKELIKLAPAGLDTVYFGNSGAEAVETAIKYARAATGKKRIIFCKKGYHGLTIGALSVNGGPEFRTGFGDLLEGCCEVPFNDLSALEKELAKKDVAGFIVEPIQGKGVFIATPEYLPGVRQLCTKYGAIMIADEVQSGMGRTGKFFAVEHWNVEPDIICISKALSGGYVPVSAVLSRREIHNKVFSSLERSVVHSNTFGQNDLAMAAGLVTLHVFKEEKILENCTKMGNLALEKFKTLAAKHPLIKDVRGKGLMLAIEFGSPSGFSPSALALKATWTALHTMDKNLFPQVITMPLMRDHKVLTQVAGHNLDVIKMIPPLIINEGDVNYLVAALDKVIGDAHNPFGPHYDTVKHLASQTFKTGREPVGAK
jgi:ornithine--oxo-acid transaminase